MRSLSLRTLGGCLTAFHSLNLLQRHGSSNPSQRILKLKLYLKPQSRHQVSYCSSLSLPSSMKHLASPSSSSSSSSSQFRRKTPIVLARYALVAGAISTILLLFWISTTSVHDHSGDLSFLSRDRKDGNFQEYGEVREDEEAESEREGGEIRTEQQRSCAIVEEMGEGFAAGWEKESLRGRELIKRHFEINGRFQGAAEAVAFQFFLNNIHPGMMTVASALLGNPKSLQSRPNVFGELMRVMISPSQAIQEEVIQYPPTFCSSAASRATYWGHAWNRFTGRLSCRHQPHQCAFTPLLPSGWWDGEWQSPIPRDIHRLKEYSARMTQDGQVDEGCLESYCRSFHCC